MYLHITTVVQEMYWYIAKDEKGLKGMVPGNFLKPLEGIYIYLLFAVRLLFKTCTMVVTF